MLNGPPLKQNTSSNFTEAILNYFWRIFIINYTVKSIKNKGLCSLKWCISFNFAFFLKIYIYFEYLQEDYIF